ncbi:MAG: hypothetical protein E7159_01960 [Firmicutes bacterium]|nr:hypothetical protein [Bacillota bacterium]
MNEFYFKDINDLYNRLKPALRSKVKELKIRHNLKIKEEDIFKYLADNKWPKSEDLTLYDMVEDILYLDNNKLIDYVANNIKEAS